MRVRPDLKLIGGECSAYRFGDRLGITSTNCGLPGLSDTEVSRFNDPSKRAQHLTDDSFKCSLAVLFVFFSNLGEKIGVPALTNTINAPLDTELQHCGSCFLSRTEGKSHHFSTLQYSLSHSDEHGMPPATKYSPEA